jgi:hypothetical protein
LYRSPHENDFEEKVRIETFEKIVTSYLNRVNEPNFNYDKFYEEQRKSISANEFSLKSSTDNEYQSYIHDQKSKDAQSLKLRYAALQKGSTWSEDFSDEELKVVLKEVSEIQESDRRVLLQTDPKNVSAYFTLGLNLTDDQSARDTSHRQSRQYSLETEIELQPLPLNQTLKRFSLGGLLRYGLGASSFSGKNTDREDLSLGAALNWYPFYLPSDKEVPAYFIGTSVRAGTSNLETPSIGEKGQYSLTSFPSLRVGMKYTMPFDMGMRFSFELEKLNLNRYSKNASAVSVQSEEFSQWEGKINLSFLVSF